MSSDFSKFVAEMWHDKPVIIVLFVGGLLLFVLLVMDTYRHRKRQKRRHGVKRLH